MHRTQFHTRSANASPVTQFTADQLRRIRRDAQMLRRFFVTSMVHLGLPVRLPANAWLAEVLQLRVEEGAQDARTSVRGTPYAERSLP